TRHGTSLAPSGRDVLDCPRNSPLPSSPRARHAKEILLRRTAIAATAALVGLMTGFHATYAAAATRNPWAVEWGAVEPPAAATLRISFAPDAAPAPLPAVGVVDLTLARAAQDPAPQQETLTPRPKSFEYSH